MMPATQKYLRFFIVFLLTAVALPSKVQASHAMGAELTYECLGGMQYRLTYAFYRDCSGISAPPSVGVSYSSSCFGSATVNLVPIPSSPSFISPVCPTAVTTCHGGVYTGIEEWIYTGIVTLPGPCADWIFAYAECCRNASITTVSLVTSDNLYVFSLLNNASGDCNNSSVFRNRPVPFVCVGQRFCFSNGAYDIDGDSISYQLITPLSASGIPITYYVDYSSTQPVLSVPAATFNAITGDLCMTPIQSEVSVFAVLVSEYRNGVLVGQVERDIQIEVSACSNILPVLSGIDGHFLFSTTFCAGIEGNFRIYSFDQDANQNTEITWDFGIPAAQFNTTGGQRDTAYFSWTPADSNVSSVPYCFTATVTDNNCPYVASKTYSYCIRVADSTDAACLPSAISENHESSSVNVFNIGNGNKYRLDWEDQGDFTTAKIFDASGRKLHETPLQGVSEAEISFDRFRGGIYLICLDGKVHWCKRVIHQ